MENLHLIEKGHVGRGFLPVGEWFPFVAPPLVHLVHGEWHVGVVHRENLLSAQVTGSVVEVEEISEHQPTLSATSWAIGGKRHANPSEEILIDVVECKRCRALGAMFLHE